jgi:peptide/nickel transport system permease protein
VTGRVPWFIVKRLLVLAATVVAAPTVTFTLFNWLSGNVDGSLPAFAWDYAVRTFWHFDLGVTASYREPVADVLWWSLPADLAMVLGGMASGVLLGVAAGLLCAIRPRTLAARALHGAQAFVLSSPPYWLGFMVLILFAPGTGSILQVPFLSGLMEYASLRDDPLQWLKGLWLPWVVVGLPLAAAVLRMTEVQIHEAMGEEFIRTAQAKGLTRGRVVRRHALPLALGPVAALAGATMPVLITNVALMESAFNIPGIYREIRHIGSFADYALLQGMIIETTVIIVLANMAADAVQARLDPTVR